MDYQASTTSPLNMAKYEGVYSEKQMPGQHLILQRESAQQPQRDKVPVIEIPVLEEQGRNLLCEYRTLDSHLTDAMAQQLIIGPLLTVFYENRYKPTTDAIVFINLSTGTRNTVAYGNRNRQM